MTQALSREKSAAPESEEAGLDALLERFRVPGEAGLISLAPERIEANPVQPRQEFDPAAIDELARSIERHGLLQPLTVRKGERAGTYELVAGERRLRAARKLGLARVPCVVAEIPDERMLEVALVENLQRRDLDAIDTAAAYRALIVTYGYTQEELAQRLSVGRSSVTNALRLLELPPLLRGEVSSGRISAGHARALASLDDARAQREIATRIEREALTVRETEAVVARRKLAAKEPARGAAGLRGAPGRAGKAGRASLEALEARLRKKLGTKVTIEERGASRGRIVVDFYGEAEFERLLGLLDGGT